MPMQNELAVWWLSSADLKAIFAFTEWDSILRRNDIENLPAYFQRQLSSLRGRAGHGRLWLDMQEFHREYNTDIRVQFPPPDSPDFRPLDRYISEHCGGIVIRLQDVNHIKDLPGVITDLKTCRFLS